MHSTTLQSTNFIKYQQLQLKFQTISTLKKEKIH